MKVFFGASEVRRGRFDNRIYGIYVIHPLIVTEGVDLTGENVHVIPKSTDNTQYEEAVAN
jgi:hypothetical protein